MGTEGEDGESWWELCRECTAALCLKDSKASYASDGSKVGGMEQTWNLRIGPDDGGHMGGGNKKAG